MKLTSLLPATDKYASFYCLARNVTTSIIHTFSGGSSHCGSSRRNTAVSLYSAQVANPVMFCEKCFPNGKPAEFFEIEIGGAK